MNIFPPFIEYLSAFQGNLVENGTKLLSLDFSLLSLMGYLSYKGMITREIYWTVGTSAGWGWASGQQTIYLSGEIAAPFAGQTLVWNVDGGLGYQITPQIGIGIVAGYRLANVSEMKATKDVSIMGITILKEGEVIEENGNAVPFNFSGFKVGLDVNFTF
ncbi:hypothetical protein [Thermospira aquatica]|uniref:Uncharacterized protein n=1 Tax=Thermospira aquatica TaxID=2828656 RepID=A0AAX3BBL5_9SPIR|nr:hypothetical protein [Thermospira aquatica]URA09574.1 hypothetical protein KDW03_08770 [Thermospira aquatica]